MKLSQVIPNTVSIVHRSADKLLGPQGNITSSAPWNLYGALYGVEKNVQLIWDTVHQALQSIEGAVIQGGNAAPSDHFANLRVKLMRGIPAYEQQLPPHSISFSASSPIEGDLALEMKAITEQALQNADMVTGEDYALEYLVNPRALMLRIEMPYNKDNYAMSRKGALAAISALQAKGFTISHDSIELRSAVAASQTGNGLKQVYRYINSALDPEQILS